MPWAIITLREGATYDGGGRVWERKKPLRTNKQSLINWAKANSRFRVVEEVEPEKAPRKPQPLAPEPEASEPKPRGRPRAKAKVKKKRKASS